MVSELDDKMLSLNEEILTFKAVTEELEQKKAQEHS